MCWLYFSLPENKREALNKATTCKWHLSPFQPQIIWFLNIKKNLHIVFYSMILIYLGIKGGVWLIFLSEHGGNGEFFWWFSVQEPLKEKWEREIERDTQTYITHTCSHMCTCCICRHTHVLMHACTCVRVSRHMYLCMIAHAYLCAVCIVLSYLSVVVIV